jgi:hypothetical protein
MARTWTDQQLIELLPNVKNMSDLLDGLNLVRTGDNSKTVKNAIKRLELTPQFVRAKSAFTRINREELLVEDCKRSKSALKSYLLRTNEIPYTCAICLCLPTHNNKDLVLQLDHINGVSTDNRLENLRWLCPNCHSQTDTFCGKNTKRTYIKKEKIEKEPKPRPTKISWPTIDELQRLLWTKPATTIAKELGVSDKAVEKRAKKFGLSKPKRGYWIRA